MDLEHQIIDYWCTKIPSLSKEVNVTYPTPNEEIYSFQTLDSKAYHFLYSTVANYFNKLLYVENFDEIKVFFQIYNDFIKLFKGKLIAKDFKPNDIIISVLFTEIFDIIDNYSNSLLILMPKDIQNLYKKWKKSCRH